MNPKIHLHFLATQKRLGSKAENYLKGKIEEHALKACCLLKVPSVNATVYPNSNFVIPETGEGGYAVSGDWFHIYIDPARPEKELKKIISDNIPLTIYHELNHVARWNGAGYGSTLPEAIVSEGLASVFAAESWKKANSPWVVYSQQEIVQLMKIYQERDRHSDSDYNHGDWFYGAGELQRWIGYKLGFHIIKLVRKNNPKVGWDELVKTSAKKILSLSGLEL